MRIVYMTITVETEKRSFDVLGDCIYASRSSFYFVKFKTFAGSALETHKS